MNKVLTVTCLVGILVVGALAQAAGPTGGGVKNGSGVQGAKQGAKRWALRGQEKIEQEILGKITPAVSAEQRAQIKQLNARTMASMQGLKDKAQSGDREALKVELKKIQEQRRNTLKTILTPEQQKSYMALMKEAILKMRKDGAKKGGNTDKAGKGGSGIG